jgi:serine/threonine protein kinase
MPWTLFRRDLSKVGPYEILGRLGKGMAGSVFKARHAQTGLVVALKVLRPQQVRDPLSLKRFAQEFHATRTLDDPHVVRGLDFGQDGAAHYLAMEFIDGPSLEEHLKAHGRLPEADALRLAVQVGQALHRAHERGLIHRDVKPGNILLGADGRARLTDFGLVKCLAEDQRLTATGTFFGTPCFMAPEQFDDAKRVDRRCDVYGLAATLYMALTGQAPFHARGYLTTVRKKLAGDLVPPRELVPGLTPRVDWAVLRALSVSPSLRPASCLDFLQDLTGGQPLLAAQTGQGTDRAAGPERRSAVRYPCLVDGRCLPVGSSGQEPWQAQVRDLSAGGLCLALGRRFEAGTVLVIEWPEAGDSLPGSLLARVVRTQALVPSQWALGCQLARRLDEGAVRALLQVEQERLLKLQARG